jgi:hypothetical protein
VRTVHTVLAVLGAAALSSCHLLLGLEEATVDCRAESITCPCEADTECGPAPGECRVWKCLQGVCRKRNAPEGSPCSTGFCDGADGAESYPVAQCVACTNDSHCGGGYCGEVHECGRCDNGIQDGDEWGIDCGGRCPTCLGNSCSSDAECITGFCTDGTCCDGRCHDECAYCHDSGECMYVPQFAADNDPLCVGEMACNGGGVCALGPSEPCLSNSECASLKCANNVCTGP